MSVMQVVSLKTGPAESAISRKVKPWGSKLWPWMIDLPKHTSLCSVIWVN